ncbi:MAG: Gfo/Idh/MocA family oxidoreductase [Caldilineaceae bacterium]|jgi:predicted dehydrogenase|nr:Gfo/Idh/MocA family oxidoreductase [Caldilineaceae bacterium]
MRNQARIAVIGAGWWATEWHIPTLLAHPQAELVALVDTNPARLAQAAQHYQVTRTYASVDALLAAETLDGAVVVTNHAAHYAVAKQCLAHDLHVLVEKPLVLDARHGQELVELAQARGKELLVGYTWNFLPFVARASEVVRAGALGAIQAIHCQYNSNILGFLQGVDAHQPRKVHGPGSAYADPTRSGGGHGHTQLTHVIGLLLHITGLRAEQVSALMANHGLSVDLVDVLAVRFAGGALGTASGVGNLAGAPAVRLRLDIYCEAGRLELAAYPIQCTLHTADGNIEELTPQPEDAPPYPAAAPVNNLVDVILGRAANASPGEVGWRAAELLDAAYRSAAQVGRPVLIEELYT